VQQDWLEPTTLPLEPDWQNQRTSSSQTEPPRAQARRQPGRLLSWMRAHQIISMVLLAAILLIALAGVVGAVQAYSQYADARAKAADGMTHLKNVQAMLMPLAKQPLSIPSPAFTQSVHDELTLAEADFAQARKIVQGRTFSLARDIPLVGASASSGTNLIIAADEATRGGLSLVTALEIIQPLLQAGFLAPEIKSATPALTMSTLTQITDNFDDAMRHISTAIALIQNTDLTAIPTSLVSLSQRAAVKDLLTRWPSIQMQVASVGSWLKLAPSLLGVSAPQRLLVELLDRGEIRSTGGFIGSYGILTIQSGQIQPFTLSDVFSLDIPYINRVGKLPAPAKYSWWPFPGYGLRDSNLSFDFPTSAQNGIHLLKTEGGPDVQGVVAITIPVIQNMLKIVGPVPLPQYGVTVTSNNLESLIRKYTETGAANVGSDLPPSDQLTTIHERFTALLGRAFMAKFHQLNSKQLVSVAQLLLSSLPTKDLQLYFSDPTAENLLKSRSLDSSLSRGPQDGVTIVDSNTTGNKANLFTTTNYTDAVTIAANGSATHHLTITYNFNSSANPAMTYYLYLRYYYRTYLRVYAPSNAALVSYDGFNGGQKQINVSDEPGRQMWGGYVNVQDKVPYSLHFTWTVANAATLDSAGQWSYALIYQHQATSSQHLVLKITLPCAHTPALSFNGALDRDQLFTVPQG